MLSEAQRRVIANRVIAKLGMRRAVEAKRTTVGVLTNGANKENPTGLDGIDVLPSRKVRSRIRFCDSLSGQDTRLTLGTYLTIEEAGYAYAQAHTILWGSASRYTSDTLGG